MTRNIDRKCEILRFIIGYRDQRGYSPSFLEIGQAIGVSASSTVAGWIHRLVDEGYLAIDPYEARSVEPTRKAVKILEKTKICPCCGRIMEDQS